RIIVEESAQAVPQDRGKNGGRDLGKDFEQPRSPGGVSSSRKRRQAAALQRRVRVDGEPRLRTSPAVHGVDEAQSFRIDPPGGRKGLRGLRSIEISERAGAARRSRTALAVRAALRRRQRVSGGGRARQSSGRGGRGNG